jgi:hypothetical protein
MTEPIRYTTRPDGPTHTVVHEDSRLTVPLYVTAAQVAAASPVERQLMRVHAGLPWSALERIARTQGVVVVGGGRHERDATDAARRLADQGLTAQAALPAVARTGLWVAAALVTCGGLAAAVLTAGLVGLTAGGALAGGAILAGGTLGWAAQRAPSGPGAATLAECARLAQAARKALPAAWADLHGAREATLDPDLPVAAQVDLWSALDALEDDLVSGRLREGELGPALAQVRGALAEQQGAPSAGHDALERLQRATAAAAAAKQATRGLRGG